MSWHVHTLLLLLVGQVALSMKLQLSAVANDYLIKCAVTVHNNVHAKTNSSSSLDSNDKYVHVMHSLVKMCNMHKSRTLQLTAFATLEILRFREGYYVLWQAGQCSQYSN